MVSETISKKVISIIGGRYIGTVKDVKFGLNLEKMLGYVVFDEESETDLYLSAKDIYKESSEAVMIKNESSLILNDNFQKSFNPIGKEVFDVAGNGFGKVCDVEVKGTAVIKLFLKNCEISSKDILFAGDKVIIRFEKEQRANFAQKRKQINSSAKELPITYAMNIEREEQKTESKEIEASPPPRYTTDMKLFVGRKATATILGYNNELIVRQHELITDNVIKNAKRHNRIPQLIFNSK